MTITIQWPRFLAASLISAIVMLVLYGLWTGNVVAHLAMSDGIPKRPADEVQPLLPFLAIVSIIQLVVFAYLYLRIYPKRSISNAVWWGAWGGLFMVMPDGQFFVGTPNMGWDLLAMQMGEGIVTAMLFMAAFQLTYQPKDEAWDQAPADWTRLLIFGTLSAILVFALDIPFHQYLAPKIFTEYPAHDFPHRDPADSAKLVPWLFLTYLMQLNFFCYTFTRVYPRRGLGSAIWYGAWLGVWVVIPNMQFFVGLDKYTWHMLVIQVPEGAILTMIMMAFFELAYRPRATAGRLAAAE